MKIASIILPALLLIGCESVSVTSQSNSSATASLPESLQLFRDVCLDTTPSFKRAQAVAEKQGITNFKKIRSLTMVLTEDKRLSIQIKENKECVITTPLSSGEDVSHAFIQMLSDYLGYNILPQEPVIIELNDGIFKVFHDRTAGEAFIISLFY